MIGSYRLVRVFGIDIEIHFTFFLLLFIFFAFMGARGFALILGVFFFVTVHELCHSLAAMRFGVKVKKITLLPIGGVASMSEMPTKPYQELIIALAGPLSNLLVVVIFFWPLAKILGHDKLMYPLIAMMGHSAQGTEMNIIAHIYWLNLVLAIFNLIPAFPMDGGRILRAILSYRMSYRKATDVAVRMGHIFALFFAYIGIVYGQVFLLIIAIFIYMAASSEGLQVEVRETIKNYTVESVLPENFLSITLDTPLAKVLELVFHTHQEDFPVIEDGHLRGMITRRELIHGIHIMGKDAYCRDIMRTDIPPVNVKTGLYDVQKLLQKHGTNAMPVERDGNIVGIITTGDINRVYLMLHE